MSLQRYCTLATTLSALLTASAPAVAAEEAPDGRAELLRYAGDTWRSFEALAQPGALPADSLARTPDGRWTPSGISSPTDIAAYLWGILAAEDLRLINHEEAGRRITKTLGAVGRLERSHGFFYNWYIPETGARVTTWPGSNIAVRPFLSSVDNAWLAAALIMVRNARPDCRTSADALLAPMNFGFFYDAFDPADPISHPGQLYLGYWTDDGTYTRAHYGMANTEPRIASYIGIAKGDLPAEHYYRLNRTLPLDRGGREPAPAGETRDYLGVPVFEGHCTYRNLRLVPSWGGSMFEALMVPLFVPEGRWAPDSWGVNHTLYVRAQVEYGLEEARYGFWGFSPALGPRGTYREYGVAGIGSKPGGYPSGEAPAADDPHRGSDAALHGVVTPHAAFLALPIVPAEALANLHALLRRFPIYGEFGFFDSVDVANGEVATGVLALDQGMILAAIANVLERDAMQRHFCDGMIEAAIRPLIAMERFTAGPATPGTGTAGEAPTPAPNPVVAPAIAAGEATTPVRARRDEAPPSGDRARPREVVLPAGLRVDAERR